MSIFFYNLLLLLYKAGIRLISPFNKKAELWLKGRKNIFENLKAAVPPQEKIIWVHCSSLGEFEQGRPVIEDLRAKYSTCKILLTFFSPSGYEIRKNYKGADWVFYLPVDSAGHAKKFLDIVHPSLVIFVKYDYWYHYLTECKRRNIPLILISAIFRKEQPFFKWYGNLHRNMLHCFTHLFVQNDLSKQLLEGLSLQNVTISGDTRFDRVIEIAEKFEPLQLIEKFIGTNMATVAGSTWPADEDMLQQAFSTINNPALKLIIAPHEINAEHLAAIQKRFAGALFYSQLNSKEQKLIQSTVLIIDNIGMLAKLYRYAAVCYVGGGMRKKGLHNTLEAAVHGKPVITGPFYAGFAEAAELVKEGGLFPVNDAAELATCIQHLIENKNDVRTKAGEKSAKYVKRKRGATQQIMAYVQENRLLTS